MKSLRTVLLWTLGGLAAVLTGALIWSAVFLDLNDYSEGIAERIEQQTGLKFSLKGPLHLDFRYQEGKGLFADLGVEDAYLKTIVGMPGPQHARVRKLTLSLSVMELPRLMRGDLFEGAGRFSVTDLDLVPLATGLGLDAQSFDDSGFRAMTAQGEYQMGSTFASINSFKIAGPTTEINGDLRLQDLHQDARIEFALSSASLNLDEIVSEEYRGPLDAFEWLSLSPLLASGISARGVVQIGRFQAGGLVLRNLNIPIYSEGGAVVASPVTGDLYGGTMRIDTVAHTAGADLDFRTKQVFLQVEAGELLQDLGLTHMLRGRADFTAIVAFSGAEYLERIQSARGVVTLTAKKGQVRGFDIASLLDRLSQSNLQSGGDWLGENAYTPLENITATLRLEDAQLVNDNLAFRAGGLEVAGQGGLTLEDQLVDYRLSLELNQPEVVTLLPPPFNSAGLVLPIRVTGRWDNPEIMIDMPTLIQMQLQRAMGVKSTLQPPSADPQATALAKVLEAELSERLNQFASGRVMQ